MFQQRQSNGSPFSGIIGILFAVVVFYLLFKLASFVFSILWSLAPLIFLASLIIDHKVFTNYANSIYDLFKRNWMLGVGAGVFSIVLFPLVSVYLLGKALFKRKMNKAREEMVTRRDGELIDYEEIDSEIIDMDLPPPPPPAEPLRRDPPKGSKYDDLF
ncbi:hypothetical protein CEQ90_06310 [Lewinellaceae bacterium SD302]|nr:hypothetical protein CEQ90_06310 [Lewinellaceae bacterium SD302]